MFVRMPPVDSIDRDLANMQKLSFSRDQVRRLVGMPLIPAKGGKAPNVSRIVLDPPKEVPVVPRISGGSHVVKEGETISEIAVFHGVSVQSICLLNHIDSADHVKVGKLLKIPAK
jgi:LysM repeat protein